METKYEVSNEQVNAFVTTIALLSLKRVKEYAKLFAQDRDLRTYCVMKHYLGIAERAKNYLEEHIS